MSLLAILGLVSIALVVAFTFYMVSSAQQGSGQTRRSSMIEAWINIAIGFSINYVANLLILPLVGLHIGAADNFWMGCIYTAISVLRQFAIRRWFNSLLHSASRRLAGERT